MHPDLLLNDSKIFINGKELSDNRIETIEMKYVPEYIYNKHNQPIMCFDRICSTATFECDFDKELLQSICQDIDSANKVNVKINLVIQNRRHKKKELTRNG